MSSSSSKPPVTRGDYGQDGQDSSTEAPRALLKSVSCPFPRRPTARNKGFVRPNCSTTFWLHCPVCCKRYFKYDSHFDCFTRWCEICQDVLPSAEALRLHAQRYHRKNFCDECNSVYRNIKGHKTHEHPDAPKANAPKKNRSVRKNISYI